MATPARARWHSLAGLMLAIQCNGARPSVFEDASVVDDAAHGAVECAVHFDQISECDGGPTLIPGPCPDPPNTIIHSDAGWAVGCSNHQDDQRYFDQEAGACVTPDYTCVADPSPHWELSFENAGNP